MNREQIETTPAGPELDYLVAEAKGWEYRRASSRAWATEDGYWWISPPGQTIPRADTPPWSTDIAAAKPLLDELTEDDEISEIIVRYRDGEYDILINGDYIGPDCASASEVITRVWLLWRLARLESE